jgi:hypothetical protein
MNKQSDNFFKSEYKRTAAGIGLESFTVKNDDDSVSGAQISKRREFRRKRNKIRRIVLITLSIIIGILLAFIATDLIKVGTGPRPSFENSIVKKNLISQSQPM